MAEAEILNPESYEKIFKIIPIEEQKMYLTRYFDRGKTRGFPLDHLGVGDRLIYARIIREQTEIFNQDNPRAKAASVNPVFDFTIKAEMEKYGFKPTWPQVVRKHSGGRQNG